MKAYVKNAVRELQHSEMKAEDIIKRYRLRESTWTFKGFHGILHTFFPVGNTALHHLKDYYGDSFHITLFFARDNYINWYWNDNDMERLRKSFIDKVNADPKYLQKHVDDWHRELKKFQKVMDKIDGLDIVKLRDEELLKEYKEFYDAYLKEFCISMAIQDAFSLHADRFMEPAFREILKKQGKAEKFNECYAVITAPVTMSFVEEELIDRLKILKTKDKIQDHAKKYYWIRNNYAKQPVLGADFFAHELKEMKSINPTAELKGIEERHQENKKNKEALIKELGIKAPFLNLIRITETFAYMQDNRKKYVLIANHYQRLFFEEIGRRAGLTTEEIEYTAFPELNDILLEKKFDKGLLRERRRHSLCIQTLDGYEIFTGKEVDRVFDEVFGLKEKEVSEFKGTTASTGKAKGVVRIIQKTYDIVNVSQGDILVTSMTRPEMVVAMEKAAAIVTDEGGITSHAAIVSREFGIPCIVGTNIATKVLKDGDLVEVDANHGVVRKLHSAVLSRNYFPTISLLGL